MTPSRAVLIYGKTNVNISSSPKPSLTRGSAPSTRALVVIVSVALMATLAELIPASPQIPSLPSASGTEV